MLSPNKHEKYLNIYITCAQVIYLHSKSWFALKCNFVQSQCALLKHHFGCFLFVSILFCFIYLRSYKQVKAVLTKEKSNQGACTCTCVHLKWKVKFKFEK